MKKKVFICFSSGGHAEQAYRIVGRITQTQNIDFYSLTSSPHNSYSSLFESRIRLIEMRSKERSNFMVSIIGFFLSIMFNFFVITKSILSYRPACIISTGAGLSLNALFLGKIFGIKTIHIETWSRFYTQSLTGKFAYRFADVFIYQNKEQAKFYPRGLYGGRL